MHQVKHSSESRSHYIVGIDGLRALAVLAVMIFHIDSAFLPGGFTGVDIFFVISGYVVSSSLAKEPSSNFIHFTLSFYARRFLRILPALVICLFVVSLIATLFIPDSWLSSSNNQTALAAYFGYSNYALIWHSDGYFSPKVEFNPFLHTWSLGVEEQFYLLFPFVFFIWLKYRAKRTCIGLSVKWLLFIVLTVSLFYSYYETSNNQERAFYLLPSRFWELATGALLFKLHAKQKFLAKSLNQQKLYLVLGLIIIGLGFSLYNDTPFPFPWALFPVIGTSLLIISVTNSSKSSTEFISFFEKPTLVYLGKVSYSLYLWHWPVYVLFRWTIGLENMLEIVSALLLTIAVATLSYHFVETPIRKNRYLNSRENWQVILIGLVIVLVLFTVTSKLFNAQNKLSLSVTSDKKTWYPHAWPNKNTNAVNSSLNGKNLYVIGDSHTTAYSTMLQMLSDKYGVKVHKFARAGCGVANLLYPTFRKNGQCSENNQEYLRQVETIVKPGDIVFLASLRMERLRNQWATLDHDKIIARQESKKSIENRALALEETINLIDRLKKKSINIIIDAPKPVFKAAPFRCSDWFNFSNPSCAGGLSIEKQFLLDYRKNVMNSILTLKSRNPEIFIWDPLPLLCKNKICYAFKDSKPLFFDGDHLSAYGNRVLYPSFEVLIQSIWLSNQRLR